MPGFGPRGLCARGESIFTGITEAGEAAFSLDAFETSDGDWVGETHYTLTLEQVMTKADAISASTNLTAPAAAYLYQLARAIDAFCDRGLT